MDVRKEVVLLAGIALLLLSVSPVNLLAEEEKDLAASIERASSGSGKWTPACWIGTMAGSGFDEKVVDPENKEIKVYRMVGGGDPNKDAWSNRVVFWIQRPPIPLSPGYEYMFKGRLKTKEVRQKVGIKAAIRGGGVRDISSKNLSGTKDWTELVAGPFKVNEECVPGYLAVDLVGPGTVWVGRLSFIEKKMKPLRIELPLKEYSQDDKVALIKISLAKKDLSGYSIEIRLKDEKDNICESKKLIPSAQEFKESIDLSKLKAGKYDIEVNLIKLKKVISSESETITKTEDEWF